VLRMSWDGEATPSVEVPLGDFFGVPFGLRRNFESQPLQMSPQDGKSMNCWFPMPFASHARIELTSEAKVPATFYYYVDYELHDEIPPDFGRFHAQWRRQNPNVGISDEGMSSIDYSFGGTNIGGENNYVILETSGRGHYIGCNLSVTNFQGTWWGEGDDMIWVDGYKWPPDLHGTGSEDYLNQAWGMQPNAFLRNGSSIHESNTGGYQTSYVLHLENPVRFTREIKVTIEHGHGNHLCNEMS